MEQFTRDNLIESYFKMGLRHYEILLFLAMNHKIIISERQLKRILKRLRLYRRKHYSELPLVERFIADQIHSSGCLLGYRWMHLRCIQNDLVVTQETVRRVLHALDPEGIIERKRGRLRRRKYTNNGPNYLWHVDGYDKLKPYGIAISGCIDGFSRFIIWLRASFTNNDPRVICGYYINAVQSEGMCPRSLRTDFGTENRYMEHMQTLLRRNTNDTNILPAFIYGSSNHNQRIEAWWSILRKQQAQFWINLFAELKEANHFNGSFLDKELIQFSFLKLIQDELDQVAEEWNTHCITSKRKSTVVSGKPVMLYYLPELYHTKNYGIQTVYEEILACKEECMFVDNVLCDKDVKGLCEAIMEEKHLEMPRTATEAVNLYLTLRQEILRIL